MDTSYDFGGCVHTVMVVINDDYGVVEKRYFYGVRACGLDLIDDSGAVVFTMVPGVEFQHQIWYDKTRGMWRPLAAYHVGITDGE